MKMHYLLLAICLIGCNSEGGRRPTTITQPVSPIVVPAVPGPKPSRMSDKEWKRLTKDCRVVELPPNANEMKADDLAVAMANARKASLEECNARMRKIRKAL